MSSNYELVPLKNGVFSIRLRSNGETFHPVIGPVAEAEALYINQLKLRERAANAFEGNVAQAGAERGQPCPRDPTLRRGPRSGMDHEQADSAVRVPMPCSDGSVSGPLPAKHGGPREFVIWDVGLGAGGNVLTAIRHLAELPGTLHVISFDHTLEALQFAMENAGQLEFPNGFEEPIQLLLRDRLVTFQHGSLKVRWQVHVADFPALLASAPPRPAPDVIFFDAYSPARNPAMWTLSLFTNLFHCLDPERPCALATYTRSTIPRVTLLLAGFVVGAGDAVAGKEETTIAANDLALIDKPLAARWLERARTSHSAEPLHTGEYRIAPLDPKTWEQLRRHPQFATLPGG